MMQFSSNVSLVDVYRQAWISPQWAHRPALVHGDEVLRYGELAEHVQRVAAALGRRGIGQGDIVAILMERSLDTVLVILGALWAGACPCPFEPGLARADVDARLLAANIDVLVCDASHEPMLDGRQGQPLRSSDLLQDPSVGTSVEVSIDGADLGLLLFTSGSTGRPKGVQLSHGNLLSNTRGLVAHLAIRDDDRLLHLMPLYHTNGINNQLFTPLAVGASIILGARFRADMVPVLLEKYRPTIITGVPTMYARLLSKTFSLEALANLRMARCGSAPLSIELHRDIEAKLKCPLVVSYGLSEATCTSTMNPPSRPKIGSVGTVLAGQLVRLVDPVTGREVEAGKEGEICIAGSSVMIGYIGAEPDDAGRGVAGGWVRTGDLGRFDGDGYLYVTGRIKDVIIRGGENLSPHVIENVINSNAGIAASCVVGQPDADLGEVPVAFVVCRNGARVQDTEIEALIRDKLPRSHQLRAIFFVDKLPENSVGKINRKLLTQQAKYMHA